MAKDHVRSPLRLFKQILRRPRRLGIFFLCAKLRVAPEKSLRRHSAHAFVAA